MAQLLHHILQLSKLLKMSNMYLACISIAGATVYITHAGDMHCNMNFVASVSRLFVGVFNYNIQAWR